MAWDGKSRREAEDNVAELLLDGMEVAFKQITEGGLLEDVPFAGTLVKIHKSIASARDHLYEEKVARFLTCLNEVPSSEKEQMQQSVSSGKEDVERLSKKILSILEYQSDIEKSEIIANLFLAYLDHKLSERDFRRALDITSTAFLDDIKTFVQYVQQSGFMRATYDVLQYTGIEQLTNTPLIEIDTTPADELRGEGRDEMAGTVIYQTSDFGGTYASAYWYGERLRKKHDVGIDET